MDKDTLPPSLDLPAIVRACVLAALKVHRTSGESERVIADYAANLFRQSLAIGEDTPSHG